MEINRLNVDFLNHLKFRHYVEYAYHSKGNEEVFFSTVKEMVLNFSFVERTLPGKWL